MTTCVILNPNAGSLEDPDALEAALKARDLGDLTIHQPEQPEEAIRLAREAAEGGCGRIIIAGGDGSLNAMVNVLAEAQSETVLGLIPLGTGNDFARTVGIPAELEGALDVLERGVPRPVDLIRVTSGDRVHYAINVSGGGFTGEVDQNLSAEKKAALGILAYAQAVASSLPDLQGYRATVTLDGGDPLESTLWNVFVCNGRFVGGGLLVAPMALVDDGLLDILLIKAGERRQLLSLIPKGVRGLHLEHELVTFRRAKKLSISSDPPMSVNVDGELLERANYTWEILPGALSFLCPP